MSDLISRKYAIDLIEGVEWWHLNRKGELVIGAPNENEALYRAKDIFDILKFMPGAKDWIPVSEVMPDEEGKYLVTIFRAGYKYVVTSNLVCHNFDFIWEDDGVIAWMPLPKSYEESEDTE